MAASHESTERDFEFALPSDYVQITPSRAAPDAILQFTAHPSDPEDLFQFQFSINDVTVHRYGPSLVDLVRTFAVTFGQGILHHGTKILTVKRLGGTGALGLSSVVIWYQTSIASAIRGKSVTSGSAPKRTSRKQVKRPTKKAGKSSSRRAR
jgi:hypothetical protein